MAIPLFSANDIIKLFTKGNYTPKQINKKIIDQLKGL